jgi:hypothetical protein
MRKTITKLAIALGIATNLTTQAQTTVSFDTFTLSPNSYYLVLQIFNTIGKDIGQMEQPIQM